jgi:hypothetical protein
LRIWGYVILGVGAMFLVLFGLADLGGAHLGVIPYFVSVLLIAIGWNFRTSGKGIVRATPAAHAAAAAEAPGSQASAPAEGFTTVEMPLTPEIALVVAQQNARTQRLLLMVAGGALAFFVVLGALLGLTDKTPGEGQTFFEIFAGIGVACGAMIYGISWLTTLRPVYRDLHGTSYLSTTGPVQVATIFGGATLRLADRAFLMNGNGGMSALSTLGRGRVDYTPHGHVVLGAWDSEGRSVYALPGYRV